jgi:hypothetical protein
VKLSRTAEWNWRGFYFLKDLFCGVRYDVPLVLVFENNRGYDPVTCKMDLDLDQEHFFSLAKDEQFECLVSFVERATKGATPCRNAPAPTAWSAATRRTNGVRRISGPLLGRID